MQQADVIQSDFWWLHHIKFWKKAVFASLLWSIKTERFKLCLVPTGGDIISYGYCLNRLASANIWSWIVIMSISSGKHQPQKHYLIFKKTNNTVIHWKIYNDTKNLSYLFWASEFLGNDLVESKSKLSSQASLTRDAVCLMAVKGDGVKHKISEISESSTPSPLSFESFFD